MRSREIYEKLGLSFNRWKQLYREFLPPDLTAGQAQGKARSFSVEDISLIFFGDKLLKAKFPMKVTCRVLGELEQIFRKMGYFPLAEWYSRQDSTCHTLIKVLRTNDDMGFFITIEQNNEKTTDSFWGKPREKRQKTYKVEPFSTHTLGDVLYCVVIDPDVEFRTYLCPLFL